MPPKPKFQEGEKVLCYHGPLLYEAKCMRSEFRDSKTQYLIHYNGWNKNWDEWVQESRVVKNNETGVQKQRELLKNHGALTKKKKTAKKLEKEALKLQKNKKEKDKEKEKSSSKEKDPQAGKEKEKPSSKDKQSTREEKKREKETKEKESTSAQPTVGEKRKEREKEREKKEQEKEKEKKEQEKDKSTSAQSTVAATPTDTSNGNNNSQTGEPKRKRARLDNTVETVREESYLCKIEVKIKIPDDLKPVLVDDWDLITRQKMLVTVPCKQTVDDIIDEYVKTKSAKNSNINKDAIVETMLGCKDYFNVMLGPQLLYKFERPQYGEILAEHSDKPMSSIYGAIHFLRLFVRLGAMLAYTTIDERTVHILLNHVHDFLKYMSKNGATLFKTTLYEIASPDYHRKAI